MNPPPPPPKKSTYHRQARMKNPEAPLTGNTFSQKGHLIVKWRNITQQANVNISISLSVYLQQTNVRGPIFLLVVKQRRTVKNVSRWYHHITGYPQDFYIK